MIAVGRCSLTKCLKGTVFFTILLCLGCLLVLLQSVQYNNGDNDNDDNREFIGEKVNGVQVRTFTKVLIMPGGDNVPSTPPWSIPSVPILTDPGQLLDSMNATFSSRRYVTTKFSMSPGQGNLMFQYASVYGIAHRLNATVVLPEGMLLRRAFRLDGASVVSFRLSMYLLKNWKRQFYPQCCRYYEDVEHLDNGTHFALYGYFQSYKYFHGKDLELRNAIKSQFRFLPEIETAASIHLKAALKKWTTTFNNRSSSPILVGVHVRRGLDMTWNTRNQQHGHTVATKQYFHKAMSYFRQKFPNNVLFLICSDDFYWTQQNFGHLDEVYVASSRIREVDMCVLSMCNHTIMSQGTFSWWAAYLAGGETIYYDGWPRPGSELAQMMKKEDFFLPEWIPMI